MTKIVLQETNSGYNLSKINANFDAIEEFINDKAMSRDNPTADANQMVQQLDMNGQRIVNLPKPISPNEPARVQDILDAAIGILPILPASIVTNTPGHTISSTNVQSALYELADDTTAVATNLANEVTARGVAVSGEATARSNADTALQNNINALSTQLLGKVFNVNSVAGLRSGVSKLLHQVVKTLGYYGATDGGDNFYYCDLSDTTSADNGGSIIVAADGGRWKMLNTTVMNFRQWGAKGNGTTDDWFSIQNALNSMGTGIKWSNSSGTYPLSQTVFVVKDNTTIEGMGIGTRFLCTFAAGDVFSVGNGTSQILNTVFDNFSIDSNIAKTSGWAINGNQVARIRYNNIFASPPEFVTSTPNLLHGFNFNRFDYATIDDCQIIVKGTAVNANGNNDQSFGAGLYISGGTKISCNNVAGSIGVRLSGAAGGVVFADCDIINCENNVQIDTSVAGINNREVFFESGCTLDGAGFAGCNVLANSVVQLMFTGTWLASSGSVNASGPGLLIASPQSAGMVTQVTGARVFNNKGGGIICNAGGFAVSGGLIRVNGTSGSGGHGISFPTANTNAIQVTGANIIDNGVAAQGFGISMAAGCTSVNIQVNTLRNNAQGAKSIGSTGTFVVATNNVEG